MVSLPKTGPSARLRSDTPWPTRPARSARLHESDPILLSDEHAAALLTPPPAPTRRHAVVGFARATLRAGPEHGDEVLAVLPRGTEVIVVGSGQVVPVETPAGHGFLHCRALGVYPDDSVAFEHDDLPEFADLPPTLRVPGQGAVVRPRASHLGWIDTLKPGAAVTLLSEERGFVRVRHDRGEGWVHLTSLVSLVPCIYPRAAAA